MLQTEHFYIHRQFSEFLLFFVAINSYKEDNCFCSRDKLLECGHLFQELDKIYHFDFVSKLTKQCLIRLNEMLI